MQEIFINYHKKKYPKMTNQDIIKLIYQETLGPNHIIQNIDKVKEFLKQEAKEASSSNTNLYEYLGTNYVRINIHKFLEFNELDSLVTLFLKSIELSHDLSLLKDNLNRYLTLDDLKDYDYLPISHSLIYKNTYLPHYRIIKSSLLTIDYKVNQLSIFLNSLKDNMIISIEGRCASGKTTITSYFKDLYTIIPIDDFFLPKNTKKTNDLNIYGNINYRLVKDTLMALKKALNSNLDEFSYKAFDCGKQEYYTKTIKLKRLVILEGVYSSSIYFRRFIDKIVYLYVDQKTQLERINKRDLKERFIIEWIPLEEAYFKTFSIEDICDIIV